jgi:DNA-directed RNA polymerase subunit K/omega
MIYTRFEKARIVGARALQISLGAPPIIVGSEEQDSYTLAELELEKGILPITVTRS